MANPHPSSKIQEGKNEGGHGPCLSHLGKGRSVAMASIIPPPEETCEDGLGLYRWTLRSGGVWPLSPPTLFEMEGREEVMVLASFHLGE